MGSNIVIQTLNYKRVLFGILHYHYGWLRLETQKVDIEERKERGEGREEKRGERRGKREEERLERGREEKRERGEGREESRD